MRWRENGPQLRWGAWYGDETLRLPVGRDWSVEGLSLGDAPEMSDADVGEVVAGAVSQLARSRSLAAPTRIHIAVDDLSRPTPSHRFVPCLLEALCRHGADAACIRIIVAVGAHRPLHRGDLLKKLGPELVGRVAVLNHSPFENLKDFGESTRGTPIRINADFAESDVRIVCGCVLPHPYLGFGGGAKMVLPGLSGIESLEANHRSIVRGLSGGLVRIEGNEARADVEEIAGRVGVDLSLQAVVNGRRQLVGLFAGDVISSHRRAVSVAHDLYRVRECPRGAYDVVFLGAYPKDLEQYQLGNAFNALRSAGRQLLREGGTLVLLGLCPEGLGYHALHGHGMRLHRDPIRKPMLEDRELVIFSPGLSPFETGFSFHRGAVLVREEAQLRETLASRHGARADALVVPCGPLAILEERE